MKDTFWIVLLGALVLVGGVVWMMLPKSAAMSTTVTTSEAVPVTTGDNGALNAQGTAMNIDLTEFSFTLDGQNPNDPITLVAGQTYSITFMNAGSIGHELIAGNGDLLQRVDGTPDGYTNNFFEGQDVIIRLPQDKDAKVVKNLGEIELEPGESTTATFTVPQNYAGQTFEAGCFVPGHYEAGMKTVIVVQ